MSKVTIFVDAHVFDKEHQGTKTFLREVYKRISLKPNIILYLGALNISALKDEFGEQDNIHYIKYDSPSAYKRLAWDLPRILRRIRPDFAHFQYVVPPIKFCKYIVTTHDLLFLDFPAEFPWSYRISKNFLFNISIGRADIVTTVSNYSKLAISKHYNIASDRIHVTPNGINDHFFNDYDKIASQNHVFQRFATAKYILYVSRIEPRKQQALLLQAYLNLKLYQKNIDLVFVGHPSINDQLLDNLVGAMPESCAEKVKF